MKHDLSRMNSKLGKFRRWHWSLEPLEGRLLLSASLDSELAGARTLNGPADVTAGTVGPSTPVFYRIEPDAESQLVAEVQVQGSLTQLSLLNDQGNLLVQSDGKTVQDKSDLIDQDVTSGTYYFEIQSRGGTAAFTLTTTVTTNSTPYEPTPLKLPQPPEIPPPPASAPSSPIPISTPPTVPLTTPTAPSITSPTATSSTGVGALTLPTPLPTPTSSTTGSGGAATPPPPIAIPTLGNGASLANLLDPSDVPPITSGIFLSNGALDLVAADGIHPGEGDGTFGQPTSPLPISAEAADVTALATGDFNGDGRLDLVVATFSTFGQVQVLLGNGDGTFLAEPPIDLGAFYPSYLAVADFAGDGKLGVAIAGTDTTTGSGVVEVLSDNGEGGLQASATMPMSTGFTPVSLVTGDFTGDGRSSIAVEETGPDVGIVMMLSKGDGTFQSLPATSLGSASTFEELGEVSGYCNMVSGDFGGGHLDLAVAGYGNVAGFVTVLPGEGNGTFGIPSSVALGSEMPTALVAGDFGGDGDLDLAVAEISEEFSDSGNVEILQGNGALDFTVGRQLAQVNFRPGSLTAGDFNGDGRIDLEVEGSESPSSSPAVGLSWYSCFQILPGNGDGTFVIPQTAETQTQGEAAESAQDASRSMVTGDFNGDGRLDLVDAFQGSIQIFLGNGDGTFGTPETDESFGSWTTFDGIVSGDFNGDGSLDLAVLETLPNGDGEIHVDLGNGDGTFRKPIVTDLGSFATTDLLEAGNRSLIAGDFNGDNLTDLAVSDGSNLEILLSAGDGTFRAPIPVALPAFNPSTSTTTIEDLMAGDFDGNNHLGLAFIEESSSDILVNSSFQVVVLPGYGNGTFGTPILTVLPSIGLALSNIEDAVAGDFHDDGHLDLAIAIASLGGSSIFDENTLVEILPAEGNGTFGAPTTVFSQTIPLFGSESFISQMIVGDFTGDGHSDLLLYGGGVLSNGEIVLLPGTGNETFGTPSSTNLGGGNLPVVAGDFNGDGRLDLAFNAGQSVIVYFGLGKGGLIAASQFGSGLQATPLLADVTGDGTDDLLVVNQSGNILWRQGQSYAPCSFAPPITINPQGPASVAIAVIQTSSGAIIASIDQDDDKVTLFANRGGLFLAIGSLATGPLPAQVLSADLNGDGDDDLVVRNAGDNSVSIFLGDGDGGFTTEPEIALGSGALRIALADLSATGLPDLVVTNSVTGTVTVWRNLGDGSFADPSLYPAGSGPYTLSLASDGINGIAALGATAAVASGTFTPQETGLVTLDPGSNSLAVLEGLDDGTLGNPITTLTAGPDQVVRTGDFNNDGLTDLAVLGSNGLSVYMGNGRGSFNPPTVYDVGTDPTGLTVADVNHDGHLDLLVGDPQGDVLILLGDGKGDFAPPREADQAVTLAVADLDGSGSKDIIVADQGLDRVVVDYGTGQSAVVGDQATGVLAPGAVTLADLNGDGIPDLIVANSGGNDVLVYPGLGDGQFGPALVGPHGPGFPVGTDPVSVTVANLNGRPDLVVADEGSNDVTILLNQAVTPDYAGPYLPGDTFTFVTGPRLKTGIGPVSTVIQNVKGDAYADLLVSDSGSNDIRILPGKGGGYFDDQSFTTILVGNNPGQLLLGDFSNRPGQVDLVSINAGSNDLSLIADINGGNLNAQSISSGGVDPVAAVEGEFDGSVGLLVANNADGHLALFLGGPNGLELSQTFDVSGLPHPTALAMDTSGTVFGGTEGVEAAIPVILGYGVSGSGTTGGSAMPIVVPEPADQQVAFLQPLGESSFAMVTTLLSMPGEMMTVEGAATSAPLPNQPPSRGATLDDLGGDEPIEKSTGDRAAIPPAQAIPTALVRLVAGLDDELAALGITARSGGLFGGLPATGTTRLDLKAIDHVLARWSPALKTIAFFPRPATARLVQNAAPWVLPTIGAAQHILSRPANPSGAMLESPDDLAEEMGTVVPDSADSWRSTDRPDRANVPTVAFEVGLAVTLIALVHRFRPSAPPWRKPAPRRTL